MTNGVTEIPPGINGDFTDLFWKQSFFPPTRLPSLCISIYLEIVCILEIVIAGSQLCNCCETRLELIP
jgi:hypothetical protein